MGRTGKPPASFSAAVAQQFGPVAQEWGMDGPIEDHRVLPSVEWTLDRLSYGWSQDPSDGSVSVTVSLVVAEGVLWGSLGDLVVENRLAVPQQVRRSGFLVRQVESHVEWIRRLHPTLTGAQAQEFMESGGARLTSPDSSGE
ncbi:hypothetical protein [Micromonospora vulcania]|uniref:Immunity protein 53 n=1 Tax=Micromonospora vulcania TaxID=1441873 RepID=A0ABW1H498_9ACTN